MKRLAFILLSIMAITSVSCNKEVKPPIPDQTSIGIVFTGDIDNGSVDDVPMQSVATRAETTKSKATFVEGDQIGVYVVPFKDATTKGDLISKGNYADNVPFVRSVTGEFAPEVANRIMFPNANTHISIYAFAMYSDQFNTLAADPKAQIYTVATDQTTAGGVEIVKNDVMSAQALDVAPSQKPNLQFAHRLAIVSVNFTTLASYKNETVTSAAVTIDNVITKALINMTDNSILPIVSGAVKNSIKAYQFSSTPNTLGGLDCVFEAIVVPQTINQGTIGVTVALTTAVDTYYFKCELPQNVVYSSGNRTKISLAFDKEYNLTFTSATIKAWGDGGSASIDARKPAIMNFKVKTDPSNRAATIRFAQLGIDNGVYKAEAKLAGGILSCSYILPEHIIGDKLKSLTFYDSSGSNAVPYASSIPQITAAGVMIFGDPTQQGYSEIISELTFN